MEILSMRSPFIQNDVNNGLRLEDSHIISLSNDIKNWLALVNNFYFIFFILNAVMRHLGQQIDRVLNFVYFLLVFLLEVSIETGLVEDFIVVVSYVKNVSIIWSDTLFTIRMRSRPLVVIKSALKDITVEQIFNLKPDLKHKW